MVMRMREIGWTIKLMAKGRTTIQMELVMKVNGLKIVNTVLARRSGLMELFTKATS
jgi:hypothetical protein